MRRRRFEDVMYIKQIGELCAKGLNRVQIAKRLGVTHNAVLKAVKRHGFPVVVARGYESRARSFAKNASPPIESFGSGHEHH